MTRENGISSENFLGHFFSWSKSVWIVFIFAAPLLQAGCSIKKLPIGTEGCKRYTYINLELPTYLSQRFHSQQLTRMAIVPFDVPETFAPAGNESVHYGRELARKFQVEFHRRGVVPIVEMLNRDRWPGKREEFFTGNYGAIDIARNAGYDLVLVGYMEPIKDDENLVFYTKVIDTQNNVTVWYGQSTVFSKAREIRDSLSEAGLAKARPDLFAFPERTEAVSRCTVDAIVNSPAMPQ